MFYLSRFSHIKIQRNCRLGDGCIEREGGREGGRVEGGRREGGSRKGGRVEGGREEEEGRKGEGGREVICRDRVMGVP